MEWRGALKKEDAMAIRSEEGMLGGEGGSNIQQTRSVICRTHCVCGGGGDREEAITVIEVNSEALTYYSLLKRSDNWKGGSRLLEGGEGQGQDPDMRMDSWTTLGVVWRIH